jgi:hypothetical protein
VLHLGPLTYSVEPDMHRLFITALDLPILTGYVRRVK